MGAIPVDFATELQLALGLRRAVETGTYLGDGARKLARIFSSVVTIELSEELFARTRDSLSDEPTIEALHGDSRALLPALVDPEVATLFFLDGHWSGGYTAGRDAECPVLDELAALRDGNPSDCFVIDDARLFAAPPPPPHDPSHWPTLIEVFDAIRTGWPQHHVTLLADQVIAVPQAGIEPVNRYGQEVTDQQSRTQSALRGWVSQLAGRLR